MSKVKGFKDTIDWYNNNAKEYADASSVKAPLANIDLFTSYLSSEAKVLDAGCGAGRDTALLQRKGFKAIGVDISKGLLFEAKKRFPQCEFVQGDLRALPFQDETFDGVWSQASLLHLEYK